MSSDERGGLPPPPDEKHEADKCRLWIGNLDPRITEYVLLKLLQKHGTLRKYDFLVHKSGPDAGKSRGYCFATYSNREECEKAKKALNGKMALSKKLIVKQAHVDSKIEVAPTKVPLPAALCQKTDSDKKTSTTSQIEAIEAKLQLMSQDVESTSGIVYPYASLTAAQNPSGSSARVGNKSRTHNRSTSHTYKPYSANRGKKDR